MRMGVEGLQGFHVSGAVLVDLLSPLIIGIMDTHLAKLPDELSAHTTGTCRRADVCRHGDGSDIPSRSALPSISVSSLYGTACMSV